MRQRSPVVIGGVAGSGTRVYHTICSLAGYDMGWFNTIQGRDNYPLQKWFYNRWTDRYLKGELNDEGLARMERSFRLWLRLSYPVRRGPWGWKNPQAQFLLRFFHALFPSMLYIHVVRDGRDQAFNPHFTYRRHQSVVLDRDEIWLEDPIRKALHWERVNAMVEGVAEELLPERWLVSRLEDLCAAPGREVERVLAFLGVADEAALRRGAAAVRTPASLGRWKREAEEVRRRVEARIGPALEHWGYPVGEERHEAVPLEPRVERAP